MRIAGRFTGAFAVLVMGSIMFLAPAVVTGGADGTRGLPVDSAHAGPDAATPRYDETITGSLPGDAAAAQAAEAMTVRVEGDGLSGIAAAIAREGKAANAAPRIHGDAAGDGGEAVGSIAPEGAEDEPEAEVTASLADPPPEAGPRESAQAPAEKKQPRAYRPARRAQAATPPRFQDRGPVAKLFRIFVKGIGFLPSQL